MIGKFTRGACKGKLLSAVLLLAGVVVFSSLALGAGKGGGRPAEAETPVDYFLGTWVLKEPAPKVTIHIQEFLGREEKGGIINDCYKGSVAFPDGPAVAVTQVPDYNFNHVEVFNFSMAKKKDPNAICVMRVNGSSSLLLRAVHEDQGQKSHVKIQGNGQKVHDADRMYLLMVNIKSPDGQEFASPSPQNFKPVEMIRR